MACSSTIHNTPVAVPEDFQAAPYVAFVSEQTGLPFTQSVVSSEAVGVHISLSRPFTLRYEQIAALVASLRNTIHGGLRPQHISLHEAAVFVNDTGTRTFAAALVSVGSAALTSAIQRANSCLLSLGKPPYYSPAIPHASLSSLPGDGSAAAQARGVQVYRAREDQRGADTVRTGVDAVLLGGSVPACAMGPCPSCGGQPSGQWPVLSPATTGAGQAAAPPQPTTWLWDAIYLRAGHQVHRIPLS